MAFEEFFFFQVSVILRRLSIVQKKGISHDIHEDFLERFIHSFPFELTGAQKRVVKEIRADVGSGHQMNRLLQGDVGSGKTLVALLSMLLALDNNYQACLMAPTEILANQHLVTLSKFLNPLNVKVALLTGSSTKKRTERNCRTIRGRRN